MSYILEALKKIEQKRVQEELPESLTLLGGPESEFKKRPRWLYPLLAALLLNAGVISWWIGPWRAEKKPTSAQPYAVQPTTLAPPILGGRNRASRAGEKKEALRKKTPSKIPAGVPTAVQPAAPAPTILAGQNRSTEVGNKKEEPRGNNALSKTTAGVPATVQPAAPAPTLLAGQNRSTEVGNKKEEPRGNNALSKTTAEVPKKEVPDVPAAMAGRPQAPAQPPVEKLPRPKKEPVPGNRIYNLNELPPSVKNTLPELRVSVHVYNPDQQSRMVRVNDRTLQEGQELSPGLKVEEIIPGGIIFSYQGYRFRLNL